VEHVVKYPDQTSHCSKYLQLPEISVYTDSLAIVWQSPIKVTVAYYYMSSKHGSCIYHWRKIGDYEGLNFPSTPVIYINEGGLYQCKVTNDDDSVQSKIIRVYLNGE